LVTRFDYTGAPLITHRPWDPCGAGKLPAQHPDRRAWESGALALILAADRVCSAVGERAVVLALQVAR
jgi:hypothetical protein